MVIGPNVTGWSQLMDGNMILAAYTMYEASNAFAGWMIVILFFVYQFMLLMKTRNLTLSWITGVLFVSLYITSSFVKATTVPIIFIILAFELAGILYLLIWK